MRHCCTRRKAYSNLARMIGSVACCFGLCGPGNGVNPTDGPMQSKHGGRGRLVVPGALDGPSCSTEPAGRRAMLAQGQCETESSKLCTFLTRFGAMRMLYTVLGITPAVGGAEPWPQVHPGILRGMRAAAGL